LFWLFRGYGESDHPEEKAMYSMDKLTQDIKEFVSGNIVSQGYSLISKLAGIHVISFRGKNQGSGIAWFSKVGHFTTFFLGGGGGGPRIEKFVLAICGL